MILLDTWSFPYSPEDVAALVTGVAGILTPLAVTLVSRVRRESTRDAQMQVAEAVDLAQTDIGRILESNEPRSRDSEVVVQAASPSWEEQLVRDSLKSQASQTSQLQRRVDRRYADSRRLSVISQAVGTVGILIILVAVILALAGLVPLATVTGVGGVLTTGAGALVFQQSSEAKRDAQRDDDAMRGQLDGQRRLALGVRLLREVRDEGRRDEALVTLALKYQNMERTP